MKIKKGFVLRKVGEDHVVVPIGANSKIFHGMVKLNETGAFLWRFFSSEHTQEEGVDALLKEYEGVEREIVVEDVEDFVRLVVANSFGE